MEGLSNFLIDLVYFAIDWLYNAMIDIINAFILVLATFVQGLVSLFPSNPCGSLIASCSDATASISQVDSGIWLKCLQAIAWLLPMAYLVNLVGCAMMSIMIYFSIAPLMRYFKLTT